MGVHVIDAHAAIAIARRGLGRDALPEVFAPTLLRSQVLAVLRADVADGRADAAAALDLAEHACRLPRRLLGDKVLRRTAWRLAAEHGWPDTYDAEYIALTQLHGEALVADAPQLRERAAPLVPTITVDDLAGAV